MRTKLENKRDTLNIEIERRNAYDMKSILRRYGHLLEDDDFLYEDVDKDNNSGDEFSTYKSTTEDKDITKNKTVAGTINKDIKVA